MIIKVQRMKLVINKESVIHIITENEALSQQRISHTCDNTEWSLKSIQKSVMHVTTQMDLKDTQISHTSDNEE